MVNFRCNFHTRRLFPFGTSSRDISFSANVVQKIVILCFSDLFVQKTIQQSTGSCKVTSDSQVLCKVFKKQSLNLQTHEKYIESEEYCIAHHDDKKCFLPNCRYDIILIRDIKIGHLIPVCMHGLCSYTRKYFIRHLYCPFLVGGNWNSR